MVAGLRLRKKILPFAILFKKTKKQAAFCMFYKFNCINIIKNSAFTQSVVQ